MIAPFYNQGFTLIGVLVITSITALLIPVMQADAEA